MTWHKYERDSLKCEHTKYQWLWNHNHEMSKDLNLRLRTVKQIEPRRKLNQTHTLLASITRYHQALQFFIIYLCLEIKIQICSNKTTISTSMCTLNDIPLPPKIFVIQHHNVVLNRGEIPLNHLKIQLLSIIAWFPISVKKIIQMFKNLEDNFSR